MMAQCVEAAKKNGEMFAVSVMTEAVASLQKASHSIIEEMKKISLYQREKWKCDLREHVMLYLNHNEAGNYQVVKAQAAKALPRTIFYSELYNEIIQENLEDTGPELQDAVIERLKPEIAQPKEEKPKVDPVTVLIQAVYALGGAGVSLAEILPKLHTNMDLRERKRKRNLWYWFRAFIRGILGKPPEPFVWEITYKEDGTNNIVKETVNLTELQQAVNDSVLTLSGFNPNGPIAQKLQTTKDTKLLEMVETNTHEVQRLHKTLSGIDDYLKNYQSLNLKGNIVGIKPELEALKNSIYNANQLRYQYDALKAAEDGNI
jgi:hypothetical protein